jgi:hypothetical protein
MGVVGFRPLEQLEQHFGLEQYATADETATAAAESATGAPES